MRIPIPQYSTFEHPPHHIGEVIETSTTEFLAQCLDAEDLSFPSIPPFGSLIKSFDEESGNKVIAVVTFVTTSPIDSVHRARALGLSLEELREQQPQIFAMLKTEFKATIIGFETPTISNNGKTPQAGILYQYLPPRPPQIHQGVYLCDDQEIINFSNNLDFLHILLAVQGISPDALTAASIREMYQFRRRDRAWLVQVGRKLSLLLKDDYDRLRYILSQIN